MEELPHYIAAAKVLNANILRVWCSTKSSKDYTRVELNDIYEQCKSTVHVFNWAGSEKYPLAQAIEQWKAYKNCFKNDIPFLLEFMPDDNIASLATETKSLFKIFKD